MSTFLIASGRAASTGAVARAGRVLISRRFPGGDSDRQAGVDGPTGWLALRDISAGESMVSTAASSALQVVAFGRVATRRFEHGAADILAAYVQGESEAVATLDGAFGAAVIHRRSGDVEILSDRVGTRTLRWVASRDSLLVSPHDITLVAAGGVAAAWDRTTARSLLAYRWSVGGASLLPEVSVGSGAYSYRWRHGEGMRAAPAWTLPDDTASEGTSPMAADDILDALAGVVTGMAEHETHCRSTLTAGLDSRITLALALDVFGPRGVTTETTGRATDIDVTEAAQLSEHLGVDHEVIHPEPTADVDQGVRHLAIHVNGQTSAKRVLNSPASLAGLEPTLSGQTAEIFRGGRWKAAPLLAATVDDPQQVDRLTDHFSSLAWRPFGIALVDHDLRRRVHAQLDEYRSIARKPHDILDLYYVLDKTARWSSMLERDPNYSHVVSPFKHPHAVRHVTRLAPSWRQPGKVHRLAIERWAPDLVRWPINEVDLLPGVDETTISRRWRQIRQRALRVRRDRRNRARPSRSTDYHGEALGALLDDVIAPIVGRADGIAAELLGDDAVESLFDGQRSGEIDAIEEIGQLWSMEVWRDEIRETARAASTEP